MLSLQFLGKMPQNCMHLINEILFTQALCFPATDLRVSNTVSNQTISTPFNDTCYENTFVISLTFSSTHLINIYIQYTPGPLSDTK